MTYNIYTYVKPMVRVMNYTNTLHVKFDEKLRKYKTDYSFQVKFRMVLLIIFLFALVIYSKPQYHSGPAAKFTKIDAAHTIEYLLTSFVLMAFAIYPFFEQRTFIDFLDTVHELDEILIKNNYDVSNRSFQKYIVLLIPSMIATNLGCLCLFFYFYGDENVRTSQALKFLIVIYVCNYLMPVCYSYMYIWDRFTLINTILEEYLENEKRTNFENGVQKLSELIQFLRLIYNGVARMAFLWNKLFPGWLYLLMSFFEFTSQIVFCISRIFNQKETSTKSICINITVIAMFVPTAVMATTVITFSVLEEARVAEILHRIYLEIPMGIANEDLKKEIESFSGQLYQKPLKYTVLTFEFNTETVLMMANACFTFSAIIISFRITPDL